MAELARPERRLKLSKLSQLRTLSPSTTTAPPMRVIAYGPGAFEEKTIQDPREAEPFLSRFPVTWLNVDGVSNRDMIKTVGDIFHLHPLALEDVSELYRRAKVDWYSDFFLLVAQMIDVKDSLVRDQLSLFVGKNFVVTFQERPGDCFELIRTHIRDGQGSLRQNGPDYLAYTLTDALVDSYFPALEVYGERLDRLEDNSLTGALAADAREMHRTKRELFALRRAVWPLRDALSAWLRDGADRLGPETKLHLRDVYDHAAQIIDLLETYRELSSDLLDLYLTSVNNRMNEVMRVLTIIATIFIPTTFIASLYGMNFKDIPELQWSWGYFYALGLMAAVAIGMIIFFWRKGWLRSFFPIKPIRGPHD